MPSGGFLEQAEVVQAVGVEVMIRLNSRSACSRGVPVSGGGEPFAGAAPPSRVRNGAPATSDEDRARGSTSTNRRATTATPAVIQRSAAGARRTARPHCVQ
jgi:hypothetical protein